MDDTTSLLPKITESNDSYCIRILEKSVFTGHERGVGQAIYFERMGRLCSTSFSGDIRIWNVETGECEKIIVHRNERYYGMTHMIKWQDDILLCCYADKICSHHVLEPDNTHPTKKLLHIDVDFEGSEPMLKLDEDLFLVFEEYDCFTIYSYSEGKEVKKILDDEDNRIEEFHDGPTLLKKSLTLPNCFYSDADEVKAPIYLCDYENNNIVMKFPRKGWVGDFCIYTNERKEEMLSIQTYSAVTVYNVSSLFDNDNKPIKTMGDPTPVYEYPTIFPMGEDWLKFSVSDKESKGIVYSTKILPTCMSYISDRYYVFGNRSGEVGVYLTDTKACFWKKFHDGRIREIIVFKRTAKGVTLFSSSDDMQVKILEIQGLMGQEEDVDLEERSRIWIPLSSYRELFMTLRLGNMRIENISKLFFVISKNERIV